MRLRTLEQVTFSMARACIIIGICFIILQPLLTKLSSSFMAPFDLFDQTVRWIPRNFTLENYKAVWGAMNYPVALTNTLKLSVLVSVLQTVFASLMGYGFARFQFPFKNLIFGLLIFTLVVPPQTIIVPLYLNFRYFNLFGLLPDGGINLLNTYWPFLLFSITGAGIRGGLFVYIMRQCFSGMPKQLEDAAYVDGAGPLRTFFSVMVPSAVPSMVIVFLFSFVWQWNDNTLTSIFLSSETLLPKSLDTLANVLEAKAEYASLVNNTGMLLFMAPLLLIYAFMQRYFVESVERTGIVG